MYSTAELIILFKATCPSTRLKVNRCIFDITTNYMYQLMIKEFTHVLQKGEIDQQLSFSMTKKHLHQLITSGQTAISSLGFNQHRK